MKKIKYFLCVFAMIFFAGCTALDALLPQTSTDEISLVKEEGRYLFMVNYNEKYAEHMYLDNVQIKSGVPYYVREGKYWFRFDDIEQYRISLMFSGSKGGSDDDDFDGPTDMSYQFVKRINMNEDKIINLEGKSNKIIFVKGKGFK